LLTQIEDKDQANQDGTEQENKMDNESVKDEDENAQVNRVEVVEEEADIVPEREKK